MQLKPEEISKVIRSQIKYYENAIQQNETGTILMVGDGIARASGLVNCMSGELLEFEDGSFGMAQNLEENSVSIVIFGSDENIGEGQTVKRTGKVVSVPVGDAMVGRVVNALGQPIDGAGPIDTKEFRPIESKAPGICERRSVYQPLQTGIKAIDSMIPIGRGQRELIIGDRQTGKTTIATDTIINQKGKDVICIYVAIGQKRSTVATLVENLTRNGVIGQNMHSCLFCLLQGFSKFPMSLPVGLKPVNSLHLDHQKQISFVSFLHTMDQLFQMLHTSFCRCIRKSCYIVRFQSDTFHFYKSLTFL